MTIQRIRLQTHLLEEQYQFYTEVLELKGQRLGDREVLVHVGSTELVFEQVAGVEPYYHFAFNIPFHLYREALAWLKSRADILPWQGHELIDFSNWKAWAMYFLDPAGNIVELIARERIRYDRSQTVFSTSDILHVSEMGWGLSDLGATYRKLQDISPVPVFDGGPVRFLAAGDDEGLFIMVDKHIKLWMPNDTPVEYFPFSIKFVQEGETYEFDSWEG
jgi:catechol 2,3-dioxygenase-like lactoylglutathione lyase family enzyme